MWNHRSGKWVRLSAPPGSIIINTGDYMQRISNDLLPSTTHRVGKPRDGSHLAEARVSFPIAVYVWENEMLEVLPGLGDRPLRADQGDRLPHPQHQQILRRRLRGRRLAAGSGYLPGGLAGGDAAVAPARLWTSCSSS